MNETLFLFFICSFTVVRRLAVSNAKMGQMDVRWDNSVLPVGQYTIELEQENKKNRSVKRLR